MAALPFDWNAHAIAEMLRMRQRGASINAVAAALGCTRNAVAGKIKRLGLSASGASPIIPLPAWKRARIARLLIDGGSVINTARAMRCSRDAVASVDRDILAGRIIAEATDPPASIVAIAIPDDDTPLPPRRLDGATGPGDGIGMTDLTRSHCAWPLWANNERATFRCCGAPVTAGRPYCAAHAKRGYSRQYSTPSREWDIATLDRCTGLYLAGMPVPKIAALIGRSSVEIADKMRAEGVRFGSGHMPRRVA